MIRHCVLLSFEGADDEAIDGIVESLRTLPAQIPELRAYSVARDAGLNDGNADLAVIADFDDADGFQAYATHPEHVRVIAEQIKPIVTGRAASQIEV